MITTIKLGAIDLGSGVVATKAQLFDGPFALITASTADGRAYSSRLDIQKGMFIDALPGEKSAQSVQQIVRLIAEELSHHRH